MKKFEYKFVILATDLGFGDPEYMFGVVYKVDGERLSGELPETMQFFADLGENGWEAISIAYNPNSRWYGGSMPSGGATLFHAIFKRQLTTNNESDTMTAGGQ